MVGENGPYYVSLVNRPLLQHEQLYRSTRYLGPPYDCLCPGNISYLLFENFEEIVQH